MNPTPTDSEILDFLNDHKLLIHFVGPYVDGKNVVVVHRKKFRESSVRAAVAAAMQWVRGGDKTEVLEKGDRP